MNIVLDKAIEMLSKQQFVQIGKAVIRGSSIVMWECIDKVN